MSYIVELEDNGKYLVRHTQYPNLEVSAGTLYDAIEAFDKMIREQTTQERSRIIDEHRTESEIVIENRN